MMTKNLIIIVLLCIFASCGNPDYDQGKSDWIDTLDEIPQDELGEVPDSAPYAFKTGVIEYESSTLGMKQQVITMFCNFGFTSRTEIISRMLGQSIKQMTLVNDTAIFTLNLIDSIGSYILLDSAETELNFRDLSKEDMEKNQITQSGTDEILEKNCTIYELYIEEQDAQIKNWVWEGITLKSVSRVGGIKVTMVAKKLRVNVNIPDEKFEVPEGFSVRKNESDSLIVQ